MLNHRFGYGQGRTYYSRSRAQNGKYKIKISGRNTNLFTTMCSVDCGIKCIKNT